VLADAGRYPRVLDGLTWRRAAEVAQLNKESPTNPRARR
jgi:hypothetical protein